MGNHFDQLVVNLLRLHVLKRACTAPQIGPIYGLFANNENQREVFWKKCIAVENTSIGGNVGKDDGLNG